MSENDIADRLRYLHAAGTLNDETFHDLWRAYERGLTESCPSEAPAPSGRMTDPAPLTAEERERIRWDWVLAAPLHPPSAWQNRARANVASLLAALDAAETRLADARREALEPTYEMIRALEDELNRTPVPDEEEGWSFMTCEHLLEIALAAPRPTEETTK